MALFTKKDLGLLLPDDVGGDAESLRHTQIREKTDTFEALKPMVDRSKKVLRHRAGQRPVVQEEEDDDAESEGFVGASAKAKKDTIQSSRRQKFKAQVITSKEATFQLHSRTNQPSGQKVMEKSMHARGLKSKGGNTEDTEAEQRMRILERNQRKQQESSEESEEEGSKSSGEEKDVLNAQFSDSSSNDEEENEITSRRQRIRAQALQKEKEVFGVEEKNASASLASLNGSDVVQAAEESEGSSSSEWETDTDDSENEAKPMLKPIYVPKKARDTIREQEEKAQKEEQKLVEMEAMLAKRRLETKCMVAEVIRKEKDEKEAVADSTDADMPDDTDGTDPQEEYKQWELRELRRIKRDQEKREAYKKDEEEKKQRQNMTEEELIAENERLGRGEKAKLEKKGQWKFLQKYHHKGVFYMDEESIRTEEDVRRRDISGSTLEDNFNKEMMPKVMQVKNFGRTGRTKYTHLADQDTTQRDSFWAQPDRIRKEYQKKLTGTGQLEDAGRKHKRVRREQPPS